MSFRKLLLVFFILATTTSVTYLGFRVSSLKKDNVVLHSQNKYIMKHLSGGVNNIPKAHGVLRKRQKDLTRALVHFDEFAKKHNIEYWIDYGTLLGSYRHAGFIPWDDDIDISMTEENLNKLKELAKDPNNKIELTPQNPTSLGGLWFFSNEFGGFDIFNFVFTTKDQVEKQKKYVRNLRLLKHLTSKWKKWAIESYDSIKIDRPDLLSENEDTYLIMTTEKINGFDGIFRNNFQVNDIFPLSTIVFEGHKFPAPHNIEAVLSKHYGKDFKSLPDDFGYSHHLDSW